MMSFWREMRRRHVFRIAGIYVAVGWILIEVLANVLPMFEAPEWFGNTITLLIFLFFPIALIIAWSPSEAFESYINADYISSENSLTGDLDGAAHRRPPSLAPSCRGTAISQSSPGMSGKPRKFSVFANRSRQVSKR